MRRKNETRTRAKTVIFTAMLLHFRLFFGVTVTVDSYNLLVFWQVCSELPYYADIYRILQEDSIKFASCILGKPSGTTFYLNLFIIGGDVNFLRAKSSWTIRIPSKNSVAWVRERTIPTERPPLIGEVNANFCGYRVPRGQLEVVAPLVTSAMKRHD
jgi:hypothetical protein